MFIFIRSLLSVGVFLISATSLLGAQRSALEPAPGVFLVANREMPDPRFAGTVILLLEHNNEGTVGLVLNRPADLVLPPDDLHLVYIGGPVSPRQVIVLGRGDPPEGPFQPVWEDVWWSADRLVVDASVLRGGVDPSDLRVFAGYAGWAPGQLNQELSFADSWELFRGGVADVFDTDPADLWDHFMGRGRPVFVWRAPGR